MQKLHTIQSAAPGWLLPGKAFMTVLKYGTLRVSKGMGAQEKNPFLLQMSPAGDY